MSEARPAPEFESLARLARAVTASLDLDDVLDRVARAATELVPGASSRIWGVERDRLVLRSESRIEGGGPDGQKTVFALGEGLIGQVAMTREPLVIGDIRDDPRIVNREWIARERWIAFAGFPLLVGDRLVGVLAFALRRQHTFTLQQREALGSFGTQAAIAIENARLYQEAAAHQRRLATIVEVARRLTTLLDAGSVLETVRAAAVEVFGAEVGFRLLEGDELVLRGATAGAAQVMVRERLKLGESISGRVAATGVPIVVADTRHDPRTHPEHRASHATGRTGALMCVPIRGGSRILGTLNIFRPPTEPFDGDALGLARSLADQAGVALESARLYEETTRRRREAEELARLARELTESLDVDEVSRRIARSVLPLFGAMRSRLRLLDPDGRLRVVAEAGISAQQVRDDAVPVLPAQGGVAGRAVTEGRPVWSSDVVADPSVDIGEVARREIDLTGTGAILAVPLRAGGRIIGSLTIGDRTGRVFFQHEATLLQAFGDQAAIAIENARLFAGEQAARAEAEASERRLENRVRQQEAVAELGERALQDAEPSALVREAVALVARTLDVEYCTLLEFLPDGRAVLREGVGWPAAAVGHTTVTREEPPPDAVPGAPAIVDDVRATARFTGSDLLVARGVVSSMRVTVHGHERPFGELGAHSGRPRAFSRDDVHFLQAVAHVLAMAVERRRAGMALRQSQEQFLQAQKMEVVGQLAGGVAHDFNNLLTVIIGRCELLGRRRALDDATLRSVMTIRKTADRGAALTRALMAFSRKQLLQTRVVDVNDVVAALAPMLESLVGEHIELGVAPQARHARVKADPNQLEQIIVNLAINARDAMPRGGQLRIETANVEVDATAPARRGGPAPGRHVRVSVIDTGTGMDAVTRARMFEPFFTTKAPGKGTGLGLSTVYGIVHQHQGTIEVESAPGEGTRVTIHFPLTAETVEPGPPAPPDPSRGTETILLVEDENDVRELTRDILQQLGYVVLEAATPAQATLYCRQHERPIDLLLTDVVMPQLNGRELAEHLQPLRPAMKVLYMSGYTADVLGPRALVDPTMTLLQKPFTQETLARKVRAVLDARAAAGRP